MSKRNPFIPFGWWPASWGLRGKTRLIAEAEYIYDGIDLDYRLAEIDHPSDQNAQGSAKLRVDLKHGKIDQYQYDLAMIMRDPQTLALTDEEKSRIIAVETLNVELKHGKIDQYQYDSKLLETNTLTDEERLLASLDVELKHGRIAQQDYERKMADIKEEPWLEMPRVSWDPENSSNTFFEIDYNDYFVQDLRDHGYEGTETVIIDQWISDICSAIADEMNAARMPESFVSSVKKKKISDERTEHS